MPGEIGLALELVLALLKQLAPSQVDKLKSEIAKLEKERIENETKLLKAIHDGDITAINNIINQLFHGMS